MFDIGWAELLFLGLVALVVLGPSEIPSIMRTLGSYSNHMRKIANDFKASLEGLDAESLIEEQSGTHKTSSKPLKITPAEDMAPDLFADADGADDGQAASNSNDDSRNRKPPHDEQS